MDQSEVDNWVAENLEIVREAFEQQQHLAFQVTLVCLKHPATGLPCEDPTTLILGADDGNPSDHLAQIVRDAAKRLDAAVALVVGIMVSRNGRYVAVMREFNNTHRIWIAPIRGTRLGEFEERLNIARGDFANLLPTPPDPAALN